MSKNIVLCFDGTGQAPAASGQSSPADTNVLKFSRRLPVDTPRSQVSEYVPGIGSRGSILRRGLPGVTALGFTRNIERGYRYLVRHYRPDDRIFLFGFSRGAFTARTLAEIVGFTGILVPEEIDRFREVLRLFIEPAATHPQPVRQFLRELPGGRQRGGEDRQPLPIHMLGVWDTVAALGAPPASAPRLHALLDHWAQRHRHPLPPHISHARHAIALHEQRPDFAPVLWTGLSHSDQSLRQCWFAGNHSDVGGGYAAAGLSDHPLRWMASEAENLGLQFQTGKEPATIPAGTALGDVHNEFGDLDGKIGSPSVRAALYVRMAAAPPGQASTTFVHASALQRLKTLRYRHFGGLDPTARAVARNNEEIDRLTAPFFLHHYFTWGNQFEH